MADLNALIAQGYQFQAPPDPFVQYGKMQQLQQNEQANQLNQLKMQEAQIAAAERNALRGLDPASSTYLTDIKKINPKLGFEFAKLQQEAKTAGTEGQIKDTKLLADKLALLPDMYARADTPDAYIALHESIHADPILGNYLKNIGATKEQGRAKINEAITSGKFDDLRAGSMRSVAQVLTQIEDAAYGQNRNAPAPQGQLAPGAVPMGAPNISVTPQVSMPAEPMVAPAVMGLNADQARAELAVAPNALAPQVAPVNALAAAPTVSRVKQIDDRLLEGNTSRYKNSKGWADEKEQLKTERADLVKLTPELTNMKALGYPITPKGFEAYREAQRPERMLNPAEEAQKIRIARSGATTLNVSNVQEKAEAADYGKLLVKDYDAVKASASLAQKSIPAIESNLAILNKGFDTGTFTESKAAAAKVLGALGVKDAEKYATDSQAFLANASAAVLQRQLEQKGPQTEADAQRITQTGAQLGNTKAANEFVLKVAKSQLQRDIEQRDFYANWRDKNQTFNGAENAWSTGPGSKSLFERPELKAYAAGPNVKEVAPDRTKRLDQIFGGKR